MPAVPVETVLEDELRQCILPRRRALGRVVPAEPPAPRDALSLELAGLALSGGGIRSATFNLGLLQALSHRGVLPRFDFLSTVSGGGYIGSCLTSLLSNPQAGVDAARFPFRFGGSDERAEIKHLRQHGNYLAPRHGPFNLDTWRLISAYLLGLVISLATGLALLCAASVSWILAYPRIVSWLGGPAPDHDIWGHPYDHLAYLFGPAGIAAAAWFLVGAIYVCGSFFRWTLRFRDTVTRLLGFVLLVAAVLAAMGALPLVFVWLSSGSPAALARRALELVAPWAQEELAKDALISVLGAAASAVAVLLLRPDAMGQRGGGLRPRLFRFGATALMVLTLLLVLFAVWDHRQAAWPILGGSLAILVLVSLATDINRVSMFYFYRDRLSAAYVVRRDGAGVTANDGLLLSDVRTWERGGPYHLLNAAVNLTGSRAPELRGRKSDFFLLSPLYCGSRATGYLPAKDYEGNRVGLASAMALSGAATNPQYGLRTNPALAFLMALLNVRLGVWGQNPRFPFVGNWLVRRLTRLWPYYLALELLAQSNERRWFVNLSDGGHIENLGVYELLRRRCSLILASDAGADPQVAFEDLGNLVRKARIDMGIQITLDPTPFIPDASGFSQDHVVSGTILYPEGKGTLIYVKSAVLPSDSQDLRQYKREHASFPHESTADQFFDEAQFESYRELGYSSGIEAAELGGLLGVLS
jgi:hypothetical protein